MFHINTLFVFIKNRRAGEKYELDQSFVSETLWKEFTCETHARMGLYLGS
jgi:hypothetical protein